MVRNRFLIWLSFVGKSITGVAILSSLVVRQGGAAEGGLTGIDRDGTVGFPYAGIKLPTRFMSLLRASCSPNASQRCT